MVAFIMKKSSPIFACLQQYLDKMNRTLRENLAGVRVIRAFNKEASETRRMKKTFENYANASIQTNYLFASIDCLSLTLINLCLVAILYLDGNSIGLGHMKIGDLTAISEYTIWILAYVMMAQMTLLMFPRALTCLHRISVVLKHDPEITDGPIEKIAAQGTEVLSFDNVSFRFTGAGADTLSRLSFTCRRGQTTAIIGGTGSGKSTLAQLALRFHDVTGDAVTLFGQDIRRLSQDVLRQAIAYVRKKPGSFPGLSLKTCATGTPRPAMPPSAMPCRQRMPLSSKTCPRACIPLSPRAVRIFSAARSNVWLLPWPWSKRPSSTSSTTVSLPWISRQMPPCAGPCQQS